MGLSRPAFLNAWKSSCTHDLQHESSMNPGFLLHSPVVAHGLQSASLSSHLSSLYCLLAAAASSATSCFVFPGGAWLQALNPSFHVCSALSDSEHFPAQEPPVLQQLALPSLFLPQTAQVCPAAGLVALASVSYTHLTLPTILLV